MRTLFLTLAQLFLLFHFCMAQQVIISKSTTAGPIEEMPMAVFGAIDSITGFDFHGHMPDDPLAMLQKKQIQKEINLSDEQIAIVVELQKDIQRQMGQMFAANAKFGGDAGKMIESARKAIQKNIEKELKEILDFKQMKRLGQLEVQMKMKNRGVRALTDDKLSKALAISDKQKKQIQEEQSEMQKELQKEIQKLREKFRTDLINELLTDDQLTKLEELSGEEYDVKPVNIRRFGQ